MYDWATPLLSKDFDGFVYFDLGGVVFGVKRSFGNLAKLANKSVEEIKTVFLKYDTDACKGLISPEGLGKIYEHELALSFGDTDFLSFWLAGYEPIPEMHKLIKDLVERRVQVGIITNIYRGTFERLGQLIPKVDYRAIIESCDYGIVKPDFRIFEIAEKACGFEKSKITLIDDNQDNITAATNFGWKAILLKTA